MVLPDNYILIHRNIKHARLRVSENGDVSLYIPNTFTDDDVVSLIEKKRFWIEKQQVFFQNMHQIILNRNQILLYGNRYTYFYDSTCGNRIAIDHDHRTIRSKQDLLTSDIQEKWLRKIAKKHISKRLNDLSISLNISYNKLYVRSQKRKWGNCSKEKNISINWHCIKAPLFVIDYLIVHELVHTLVMTHSNKYWTLLRSYYPDYKDAIKWLDKYGNSLKFL